MIGIEDLGVPVVHCRDGESVFEACRRAFGEDFDVVGTEGCGMRHPVVEGMVGIIRVRPGERFAVVGR